MSDVSRCVVICCYRWTTHSWFELIYYTKIYSPIEKWLPTKNRNLKRRNPFSILVWLQYSELFLSKILTSFYIFITCWLLTVILSWKLNNIRIINWHSSFWFNNNLLILYYDRNPAERPQNRMGNFLFYCPQKHCLPHRLNVNKTASMCRSYFHHHRQ